MGFSLHSITHAFSKAWDAVKSAATDIRDVVEAPIAAISSGVASKGAQNISQNIGGVLGRATGLHNWTDLRNQAEEGLSIAGNLFVPGSSALTSKLLSNQTQKSMNTLAGKIFQFGSSFAAPSSIDPTGEAAGNFVKNNITTNTIAVNAATGAATGAEWGAFGAAASGQNIGKGALKGGVAGGVSGGVSTAAGDVFGTSRLGQGASAGLGTYAGQEAIGKSGGDAARAGLASGAATFLFPTDPNASKSQQATTGFERQATSQALSQLLAPSSTGGKYQPSSGASSAVLGATQQASPGSAALAQALRVGDAGGPIFGSQGEDKKKKGAWNLESLRYMG
jgi:hypothetical protein